MPKEIIQIQAEFLFQLDSKQDWINKVPGILPKKHFPGENFIWVDVNGNVFQRGIDFTYAELHCTFPCKVYRPIPVSKAIIIS